MTSRNTYARLDEFKAYWINRGNVTLPDTSDDGVIDQLLETASRLLDSKTGRRYYPIIQTNSYDLPSRGVNEYQRELDLKDDLLQVITFLNGDDTSIASTEYNLLPRNWYPKWMLQMRVNSTLIWQLDSNGDWEGVLDLTGYWGYHNRYVLDGWKIGGTLGAAITDTTTLAFTASASHTLAVGQIIKIEDELQILGTVATNTITPLKRGDNGSTAATHANGTTIYIWQPMEEARNAVCEIANTAYRRRFGQNASVSEMVTAAGVVLSPRDIPAMAEEFIRTYRRYV